MQGIDDALKAVGGDTIQHLFEFIEYQNELSSNFYEDFETKRMAIEVGKAIFAYAEAKEALCQE